MKQGKGSTGDLLRDGQAADSGFVGTQIFRLMRAFSAAHRTRKVVGSIPPPSPCIWLIWLSLALHLRDIGPEKAGLD